MPEAVIKSVNDWVKRSVCEEHRNKMVFWDKNKERYDWDNSDIDGDSGTGEVNPSPLKKIQLNYLGSIWKQIIVAPQL